MSGCISRSVVLALLLVGLFTLFTYGEESATNSGAEQSGSASDDVKEKKGPKVFPEKQW